MPRVIPGVAEVEVRTSSDDVREIATAVARLTGPGSQYLPVPDLAKQSKTDPRFFNSSLWLMEYGSLRVLLKVNGARGSAELSVPVASFGQAILPMPKALGRAAADASNRARMRCDLDCWRSCAGIARHTWRRDNAAGPAPPSPSTPDIACLEEAKPILFARLAEGLGWRR
jgi:hypothetical protein